MDHLKSPNGSGKNRKKIGQAGLEPKFCILFRVEILISLTGWAGHGLKFLILLQAGQSSGLKNLAGANL